MSESSGLTMRKIGWIGLGSIGTPMATKLLQYLSTISGAEQLRVYNRTASRCAPLVDAGARLCNSVTELTKESDIIFISVSNDDAAKAIFEEVVLACTSSKIVVDTTTVHPDTTRGFAQRSEGANIQFVAAPVFGSIPTAEAGQLLVGAAGSQSLIGELTGLLKASFARDVLFVSEVPEQASLLKTLGNFMIASTMEIVAEAHVVAEKSGLGSDVLEKLIQQNFGPVATLISQRMTTGQQPHSGIDLALKDVGHGIACAKSAGASLPVGELVYDNLIKAKKYSEEHDGRLLDSSSMYGVLRESAGMDFRTDLVKKRDNASS